MDATDPDRHHDRPGRHRCRRLGIHAEVRVVAAGQRHASSARLALRRAVLTIRSAGAAGRGQPALRGWDSCQPNGPGRGLDALGRRSRHCHALVLARHSLVGRARSRSRLAAHGRRRPCCWMSLHTRGWPTRAVDLGEAVRAGHLRGSERVQPASARRDGSACRGWRDHVGSSRGSACGADGRDSVHQVRAFIAQRALPYLAVGRSFCS